jgi:SAM-dependent methyltransferase
MRDAYTVAYYDARADEYEDVYFRQDPAQRAELGALSADMCEWLAGRRVLELACGTGFWTQRVAAVAAHVVATDASPRMLSLARGKAVLPCRVEFQPADAYAPNSISGDFDALLANFFVSHVPRRFLRSFLQSACERIGPGGRLFLADNCFVPGLGGESEGPDEHGDCFKRRTLRDGSWWAVVKNYYDGATLRKLLGDMADSLQIDVGTHYWWVRCSVRA